MLLLFIIIGCNRNNINQESIITQLPDNNSIVLIPNSFTNYNSNANFLTFVTIDSLQLAQNSSFTEEEFYIAVRNEGVKYIIIPSEMIEKSNHNFPWIVNKNFRVCPGVVDHNNNRYFVLLVWDNAKNTYHFHKFLYEINYEE